MASIEIESALREYVEASGAVAAIATADRSAVVVGEWPRAAQLPELCRALVAMRCLGVDLLQASDEQLERLDFAFEDDRLLRVATLRPWCFVAALQVYPDDFAETARLRDLTGLARTGAAQALSSAIDAARDVRGARRALLVGSQGEPIAGYESRDDVALARAAHALPAGARRVAAALAASPTRSVHVVAADAADVHALDAAHCLLLLGAPATSLSRDAEHAAEHVVDLLDRRDDGMSRRSAPLRPHDPPRTPPAPRAARAELDP